MAGRSFHPQARVLGSSSLTSLGNEGETVENQVDSSNSIRHRHSAGDDDLSALVDNDQLQMQAGFDGLKLSLVPDTGNGANGNHNLPRPSPSISSNMGVASAQIGSTPTRSTTDLPNMVGNTARRNDGALLLLDNATPTFVGRNAQWSSNYKEASIFLEEGQNNDKFSHHPRSFDALPAYLLVHNTWFNLLDLAASLLLLVLGFFERPCLEKLQVPPQVHGAVELCALILVGVQVFLKTRWIGLKTFMLHKRTAIKVLTLVIMVVEALVVIVRGNNHFRVTRALRPIFLIDNHFCGGVRRFIRQILQSLPPILDMLGLVFFVMLIYSVFGFYLFGAVDTDNFEKLSKSFVSLFVLLTTANYPDVMMKSYNESRWSAAFFISYLSINLYFLMNLMLAVVYDAFTRIEKEKFRRLFLHKRKAAQHAFRLLVTQERPDHISFQHFEGLIASYKPAASPTEAYLIFKLLNTSKSGYLSVDEFYDIYDACLYTWNVGRPQTEWYHNMRQPFRRILAAINRMVVSSLFEYIVCVAVLSNGIILIVQTSVMSSANDTSSSIYAPWVNYFFVGLYTLEASIKLLGLGFVRYFSSHWNKFDFSVTVLGICALVFEFIGIPLSYIIILRPLRLLTLFRMKKRFRDVFGTAVILLPRLTSAVIVLLLIYYFFAIIGMELFHGVQLKDCCHNSTVEQFYKYEEGSNNNAYYYLNNFDSLPISGVTLFELTVVNNWFIIMEGYAFVVGEWSRSFFMTFYVFTMIVMTIIVAFILEAFLFRIQYKEFLTKQDEVKKLSAEIHLSGEEIGAMMANRGDANSNGERIRSNASFPFIGHKSRTKEQLQRLMYSEEMDTWLAEERLEEARSQARLVAALLREEGQNPGVDRTSSAEMAAENSFSGETVQVVHDEDEVTTIRRPILPDVMA